MRIGRLCKWAAASVNLRPPLAGPDIRCRTYGVIPSDMFGAYSKGQKMIKRSPTVSVAVRFRTPILELRLNVPLAPCRIISRMGEYPDSKGNSDQRVRH